MTSTAHTALIGKMPRQSRLCALLDNWRLSAQEGPLGNLETESIFEALDRISKSIPDQALRNIPADGSTNYRKYLYGQ